MRGDEVNGRRRERWEQIWNGNLKILHNDDLENGDNEDCFKYVGYCKSMLNGERRLENRR